MHRSALLVVFALVAGACSGDATAPTTIAAATTSTTSPSRSTATATTLPSSPVTPRIVVSAVDDCVWCETLVGDLVQASGGALPVVLETIEREGSMVVRVLDASGLTLARWVFEEGRPLPVSASKMVDIACTLTESDCEAKYPEVDEPSCPVVEVEEMFSFLFIDSSNSPKELGVIYGPFELSDANGEVFADRILFAAALCEPYLDERGFWFLPIYFGDTPGGEKVIGTYMLGPIGRGVTITVASPPFLFLGFDPDAKNGLSQGIPELVPLAEFLDSIHHDWMYPVQLTLGDPLDNLGKCGDDAECTTLWGHFNTHFDYNHMIYEAVAGLGDGPPEEPTQIVSVVFFRAGQIGIYGSDK